MSTLQEIRSAIAQLDEQDREILTAELFAMEPEPDPVQLEASLAAGLRAVEEVESIRWKK